MWHHVVLIFHVKPVFEKMWAIVTSPGLPVLWCALSNGCWNDRLTFCLVFKARFQEFVFWLLPFSEKRVELYQQQEWGLKDWIHLVDVVVDKHFLQVWRSEYFERVNRQGSRLCRGYSSAILKLEEFDVWQGSENEWTLQSYSFRMLHDKSLTVSIPMKSFLK